MGKKKPFQKNGIHLKDENNRQSGDTEGAKQEAELLFLHNIVTLIEEHNNPESLVMNLDQTLLKYVPVSHNTMAKKGVKSVSIAGSGDKRGITDTFVTSLDGTFLPIQLIYGGKTKQSLPRYKFPESFSFSLNPKHFSNTEESIKIINEIVVPYVEIEREKLGDKSQPALLILDVFRGQMTSEVTTLLQENNIFFVTGPNNMTHLFQPLDLTVNGFCKSYLKRKFAQWFAQQFDRQLALFKKVEVIEMKFQLTEIKPIHANWISQFYNHMSTDEGSKVIINSWKKSGISDAVTGGSSSLPSLDPFQDIAPLPQSLEVHETIIPASITDDFINLCLIDDDDDSEWGYEEDEFERNAFDFIIDDECADE